MNLILDEIGDDSEIYTEEIIDIDISQKFTEVSFPWFTELK